MPSLAAPTRLVAGSTEVPCPRHHGGAAMLQTAIEQVLQLPACAPNDAHPAALGERRFGAGQATDDFLLITLGTKFGGAIVRGGQLAPNATGMAGAIGHLTLFLGGKECRCGARG